MRERLSWNQEKVAEITKQADPYTMNHPEQAKGNNADKSYQDSKDNPSGWGEDQDKKHRWEGEGRTETGHPAPQAREAVVQARKLEDKALKCLTIAQRMLPGADESSMEDQATDLMFLPERAIMATLQRQTELAAVLASTKKDEEEEEEEVCAAAKAKKDEEAEEATEVEAAKAKKDEEEEEEEVCAAAKAKKDEEAEEVTEVEAAKAKKDEEAEEATEVEAAKAKKDEEAEEATEVEECKEASQDLLDVLFDSAEVPEVKTGAKKLSGLVKKASSNSDPLSNIWDTPPDISSVFGRGR